jgi:hemoglobin
MMNIAPAHPRSRDIASENDVGVLVRRFYRAAIPDPVLGPVFERFGVDWAHHLPRLNAYWRGALLDRPRLTTNTVAVHSDVRSVAPFGEEHIARWLELWEETVDELFVGPLAKRAKERARQVGRALRIAARRG